MEFDNLLPVFWISFCKEKKGLGICIVHAHDEKDALHQATLHGCNPGGFASVIEMPMDDPIAVEEVERWGKNKLISQEELIAAGYVKAGDLTELERLYCEMNSERVHEKVNDAIKKSNLN